MIFPLVSQKLLNFHYFFAVYNLKISILTLYGPYFYWHFSDTDRIILPFHLAATLKDLCMATLRNVCMTMLLQTRDIHRLLGTSLKPGSKSNNKSGTFQTITRKQILTIFTDFQILTIESLENFLQIFRSWNLGGQVRVPSRLSDGFPDLAKVKTLQRPWLHSAKRLTLIERPKTSKISALFKGSSC